MNDWKRKTHKKEPFRDRLWFVRVAINIEHQIKLIIQKQIFITSMKLTHLMMSILTTMLTPNLMWTRWNLTIQYYSISIKNHIKSKYNLLLRVTLCRVHSCWLMTVNFYLTMSVITSRKLRHLMTSMLKTMLTPNLMWRHWSGNK